MRHVLTLRIGILWGALITTTITTVSSARAGANMALQFGNSGSTVLVSNSPSLNLSGSFTIEAWVKADPSILSTFFNFIVSKQLNGTGYTLLSIGNPASKV